MNNRLQQQYLIYLDAAMPRSAMNTESAKFRLIQKSMLLSKRKIFFTEKDKLINFAEGNIF